MANKRKLKKAINYIAGDLLTECVAILHFNNTRAEDVDNVMLAVLRMQDDMLSRVSHPEPGMPAREYFRHLRHDLARATDELVEQITNCI